MNQNFSVHLFKQVQATLKRLFHNTSCALKSHYETLKLHRSCTQKDIRDSFIKLSKENHPDINKSPDAHKKFLKIQEAYNVLSKPDSRANYDLDLTNPGSSVRYESTSGYPFGANYNAYQKKYSGNPWDDPSFYHNRDKSKDDPTRPYYGIKGIKKQSNGTVALFIVLLTAVVFSIQMVVIRYTFAKQQVIMNRRSMEAQQVLNDIRERAQRSDNRTQVEILRRQFEEMEHIRAEKASQIK